MIATVTATADTVAPLGIFEIIAGITTIWAFVNQIKLMKWQEIFRHTVRSVQAVLDNMPQDKLKNAKTTMKFAIPTELREEVDQKVKGVLREGVPTKLSDMVPLLLILPLLGGCVSAAIHDSAIEAKKSAALLKEHSQPNEKVKDDEDRKAWERLWEAHQRAILAIEEASK